MTQQCRQPMAADNLQKLELFLRPLCEKGAALAFSGGVDSSLLLAVLVRMRRETEFPFLVLNARSALQSSRDLEEVRAAASEYGITVQFVECDLLTLSEVRENSLLRCYHCKKFLFRSMMEKAAAAGIRTLIEGSHADDLKAYRPGRKALAELGVVSPLEVLGFSKAEIRSMARALDVKTAERPSSPCLATRFDYGTLLTEENLRMAGEGERFLRTLLPAECDLRLRIHGKLGRIEVNEKYFSFVLEKRTEILRELKKSGIEKVALDIAGFSSGSFDRKSGTAENSGTDESEPVS